jgi:hypothetical protein
MCEITWNDTDACWNVKRLGSYTHKSVAKGGYERNIVSVLNEGVTKLNQD